jgi:translation elongation factor EF-Ts
MTEMTEDTKFERYRKFIPEVRKETGAPLMQCMKGLAMCEGNVERAIQWVKEHPGFYI